MKLGCFVYEGTFLVKVKEEGEKVEEVTRSEGSKQLNFFKSSFVFSVKLCLMAPS